jgi:hypothetical protein
VALPSPQSCQRAAKFFSKKAQKFCGELKSNYLCTPLATEQAKRQRKCFIHEDTKRDFEVDFQWKTARIRQALQKVH